MESTDWSTVATGTERESAELALVLASRGFEYERGFCDGVWQLRVPAAQAASARNELADYREENAATGTPGPLRIVGRGWPGVLVYASVLMLVAVCNRQSVFGLDWLAIGEVDGGKMLHGQWWRAATALTLHSGLDHLLGNLLFGAFFGFYAARYLGAGLAWAAITASGVLGNALNILVQAPDHRAIGASTAVFGALGLLSAYTWRRRLAPNLPMRVRIAPLIAGLGLLAYTGTAGANTDIGAHLMGFASGLGFGFVFARWRIPTARTVQVIAAAAACCVIVVAWAWGALASA